MGEGFEIGRALGDAVTQGVAQWKQIQNERAQKKRFEGAVGLYNQRRLTAQQAVDPTTNEILNEFEARLGRSPQSQIEQAPTGVINEDGSPETQPIVRTPEGDVPLAQVQQLKARKRQDETSLMIAEVDGLMEMLASDPENPLVQQFAAAKYRSIQQKLQIKNQQAQQQLQFLERVQAQERNQIDRETLDQRREEFRAGPERARAEKTFETNERIRGDLAIAQGKAGIEAANPKGPDFKNIMDLRKEYDSQAKSFVAVRDAKRQIDALSQQPQTSTNDLALLYSYIKLLDPESVVREGEVTLSRAGSVPQQLLTEAKRLFTTEGALLGPKIRSEIVANSGTVFGQRAKGQQAVEQRYTSLAQRAGADPQDVVESYLEQGQSEAPPAAGGLSAEEAALIEAVKAGQMTPDEARQRRAALRGGG